MSVDNQDDVTALARVCKAVADARDTMGKAAVPGVTTAELDAIAREVLARHGARSAPQLAYDFPGTTCISVNDELAHGIPGKRVLREGDIINIDVSAEIDGYWGDTGASFAVGQISSLRRRLLTTTRQALADALSEVRAGAPMRNIGRAVERRARKGGFRVVENICGHGVGRFIHEKPEVSNTFDPRNRTMMHEGLVIAIEPFLTTGARIVETASDGWTLKTPDGSVGAQYEHTVIVTKTGPMILTLGQAA